MTSYTWKGVSGDWNDPDNWTPAGGPPTSADDATIDGSPSADIITVDTADAANSLTLSDANATLDIDGASASLSINSLAMSAGALNVSSSRDGGLLALNGGTLDQTSGTLTLNRGGTISGGTINKTGGAFHWQGGTLDAVAYEGTLNLVRGHVGHVTGGLAMSRSSGTRPGTINVDGGSHLYFDGTQTLSNATVYLGSSVGFAYLRENDAGAVGNQVLTLASNVTIEDGGYYAAIKSGSASGDGIINDGTIDAYGAPLLIIDPTTLVNNGTIIAEGTAAGETSVTIKTAVTGTGKDTIEDNAVLQFDAGVSTASTLGDQNIDFLQSGDLLRLLDPTGFYGEISNWVGVHQIELAGKWAFSGISETGGMTTLTVSDGSTTHGFEFVGDYTQDNFGFVSPPRSGETKISYGQRGL